MSEKVRVRYAPSPTGKQHIGGVRTALFNYLFAQSAGGVFILRVEDTDQKRFSEDSLSDLYETLSWLGLSWEEGPKEGGSFGPYVQSQRTHIYRQSVEELIEKGAAYPCFCSAQRLEKLKEAQKKGKEAIGYDRHCRSLDPKEAKSKRSKEPSVVRFKIPLGTGKVVFQDHLVGQVSTKYKHLPIDPVILKSDGFPTYHLANVIDDHLMEISHVMRAQEWLPSTAFHGLLYKSFEWSAPLYYHLPMVMGKDGAKLSKRHGAVSIEEFRKQGYLPEALVNYLALLGWAYDDSREFFTKEELCQLFSLDKLKKSPATFDYKKLQWFNGHYIRSLPEESLKPLLIRHLQASQLISQPADPEELALFDKIYPLVRERIKNTEEVSSLAHFFYRDPLLSDSSLTLPKGVPKESVVSSLSFSLGMLDRILQEPQETVEEAYRNEAVARGGKLGELLLPLRVAVTGSHSSPPLFASIKILGRATAKKRIETLIQKCSEQ